MRKFLVVAASLLLLAGCVARSVDESTVSHQSDTTSVATPPAPSALELQIAGLLPEGHSTGGGVDVGEIRIAPVLNPAAPLQTEYITLHEALDAGLCTVAEEGGVNLLLVTNRAERPLFMLVGSLLLGGKQDRVLASSLVIEPGAENQRVAVFCVEPHRWSPERGNAAAAKGEFYLRGDARQVDNSVKSAAIAEGSQQEVWRAVENTNARLGVRSNEGGSFRSTYDDDKTASELAKLFAKACAAKHTDAVGFVVTRGEEVVAMDLFESRGLCAKLADDLLRSYLVTSLSGSFAVTELRRAGAQEDVTLADYESWQRERERTRILEASRTTPVSQEELALQAALESTNVVLFLDSMHLQEVVVSLSHHANVEIVLDPDVDGDQEVNMDIGRVKLRQALDLIADSCDLSWSVRGNCVYLTAGGAPLDVQESSELLAAATEPKREGVRYSYDDSTRKARVHWGYMRR